MQASGNVPFYDSKYVFHTLKDDVVKPLCPLRGIDIRILPSGSTLYRSAYIYYGNNPTCVPMWGTTHLTLQHYWLCFNFNPSSRMGTTHWQYGCSQPWNISIHVPIAGNDGYWYCPIYRLKISIHVPIAGNDRGPTKGLSENMKFQSTFPLQGTTLRIRKLLKAIGISIHVPIAGNDSEN